MGCDVSCICLGSDGRLGSLARLRSIFSRVLILLIQRVSISGVWWDRSDMTRSHLSAQMRWADSDIMMRSRRVCARSVAFRFRHSSLGEGAMDPLPGICPKGWLVPWGGNKFHLLRTLSQKNEHDLLTMMLQCPLAQRDWSHHLQEA